MKLTYLIRITFVFTIITYCNFINAQTELAEIYKQQQHNNAETEKNKKLTEQRLSYEVDKLFNESFKFRCGSRNYAILNNIVYESSMDSDYQKYKGYLEWIIQDKNGFFNRRFREFGTTTGGDEKYLRFKIYNVVYELEIASGNLYSKDHTGEVLVDKCKGYRS